MTIRHAKIVLSIGERYYNFAKEKKSKWIMRYEEHLKVHLLQRYNTKCILLKEIYLELQQFQLPAALLNQTKQQNCPQIYYFLLANLFSPSLPLELFFVHQVTNVTLLIIALSFPTPKLLLLFFKFSLITFIHSYMNQKIFAEVEHSDGDRCVKCNGCTMWQKFVMDGVAKTSSGWV